MSSAGTASKAGRFPVAIITGGATPRIGAAITRKLHGCGWNVLIHYCSSGAAATSLMEDLNALRANSAQVCQLDLIASVAPSFRREEKEAEEEGASSAPHLSNLVDKAVSTFGRVDALINNASVYKPTPIVAGTSDVGVSEHLPVVPSRAEYEQLMHTNFVAPMLLSGYCVPHLLRAVELQQQQNAKDVRDVDAAVGIVNIVDSMLGLPENNFVVYAAAKSALVSMTKSLAVDLAPRGIRVNAVAPGFNILPGYTSATASAAAAATSGDDTTYAEVAKRVPQRSVGVPDNIADAVAFLLSSKGSYINGHVLDVDGGASLQRWNL